MDTRFLDTFVAVAEFGSYAEAARRLNLTPAAVTLRVQALESDFGTRLVMRTGRTVRATSAGIAILDMVRGVARDIRRIRAVAAGDRIQGELRLGAISTALTGILPQMLRAATARHPELEVHVSPGTSIDLYAKVMDDHLDAALLVHPPFALPKSCAWHLLRAERLLLLAPEALGDADPQALLAGEPFVRYDRRHWGGRLADLYLRRNGIHPRHGLELDALESIAVMVDRGLGVALVPDWAPPWPEGLSLARTALGGHSYARRVGLIWQRATPRGRLVRGLAGLDGSVEAEAEPLTPRRSPRRPS